jgi:hypothetical protein
MPAARVVEEQASVYALDEDKEALENESVDVVLLYDVLHYYYFSEEVDRKQLLREVYLGLYKTKLLMLY